MVSITVPEMMSHLPFLYSSDSSQLSNPKEGLLDLQSLHISMILKWLQRRGIPKHFPSLFFSLSFFFFHTFPPFSFPHKKLLQCWKTSEETNRREGREREMSKMAINGAYFFLSFFFILSAFVNAEDPYRFFTWNVTYGDIYPLGVKQQVLSLRFVFF